MRYITGTTEFKLNNTCVTMGKFDGMHRGHQFLFDELEKIKRPEDTSVMFTFDYHPYNFFSQEKIQLIYTEEEKRYLLEKRCVNEKNGPDVLLSYPFTHETACMEPEEFIKQVLVDKLSAKAIVIGEDFHFGKSRRGDAELLKKYSKEYGYEVKAYEKLKLDGKVISSSFVREQLLNGNIKYVNELLGNPFTIMGTVVHGKKIGRTLGMPTINLSPQKTKLLPPNGVYFSVTQVGGKRYQGVTNGGIKPTVTDEMVYGVETYLFDFYDEIYGEKVIVEICDFHRQEMKFSSVLELKSKIEEDILAAKQYFL